MNREPAAHARKREALTARPRVLLPFSREGRVKIPNRCGQRHGGVKCSRSVQFRPACAGFCRALDSQTLFVPPRVYHTVGISPTLSPPIRLIGLVTGGRGALAPLKFNSPNTFSSLRLCRDTWCFRAACALMPTSRCFDRPTISMFSHAHRAVRY